MATQTYLPPRRPLMVLTAGDPEAEKSVLVHSCVVDGLPKPERCCCRDRVTADEAHELIRTEKAAWLTGVKSNGSKFTFRNSIILRMNVPEVAEVQSDRESERKKKNREAAQARRRKKRGTQLREIIQSFRNHLTDAQNRRYSDSYILDALQNLDVSEIYLAGLVAEQLMWQATHEKTGRQLEFILQSADYQRWTETARLKQHLVVVCKHYWHFLLAWKHLGEDEGRYLRDAAQGKGLLYLAGNRHDVDKIAAHFDDNERGIHRGTAEGFIAGSGGMTVGAAGGAVEPIKPVYDPGNEPNLDDDPNEDESE